MSTERFRARAGRVAADPQTTIILEAIEGLGSRIDRLEAEVGRQGTLLETLTAEVKQNTVNLRAMRKVLLPGDEVESS